MKQKKEKYDNQNLIIRSKNYSPVATAKQFYTFSRVEQ